MVRRLQKNRRGLATVEMAIVLLLLVMVTMGAIQYGMLFLRTQQITNAARQGARIAILPTSTVTDVENAIESLMAAAGMPRATSGYVPVITPGDLGGEPGDAITVRITVPAANVALMNTPLLPVPANLGAEVTMAKEGT
jgi:Flp pilus assembly protein TadG